MNDGKSRKYKLGTMSKKYLSVSALFKFFSSPSGQTSLTDFKLEMFHSSSSQTTDKSIPVARRTQNVKTRQGKIARAPQPAVGYSGQQRKNGNRGIHA